MILAINELTDLGDAKARHQANHQMSNIGDRFKTGTTCTTSGSYVFDGYVDGTTTPKPSEPERVIPLTRGDTFPPIKSAQKAAWWKLQRIT